MSGINETRRKHMKTGFQLIRRKVSKLEMTIDQFSGSPSLGDLRKLTSIRRFVKQVVKGVALFCMLFSLCFTFIYYFHWPMHRRTMFNILKVVTRQDLDRYFCFLPLDAITLNTIRPPLFCDFCRNVTRIERVQNMTRELFIERYAFTGRPVIVEKYQKLVDGNGRKIDFEFIKDLYPPNSPSLTNNHQRCEYQPKAGEDMVTLGHLLNMSAERQLAHGDTEEAWYAGWINCDRKVTERYKELFLPTFLPPSTESSRTFWTFMGSPKLGYSMHIDPVFRPQWHTQLHGRKKWYVEPPSECYWQCHSTMEEVLEAGDVIIFHNGMWYHKTENIGDVISIGVAAEYD